MGAAFEQLLGSLSLSLEREQTDNLILIDLLLKHLQANKYNIFVFNLQKPAIICIISGFENSTSA
jgi:hypothetical protein